MRLVSIVLFAFALGLAAFAYWGIETYEGQHAYDEMAAIVPYSAGLLSITLGAAAVGFFWWASRRARP